MSDAEVVIEVVGEGRTDSAVLPILVAKLCDQPSMVRTFPTRRLASLQGKGLRDKVEFAILQGHINRRSRPLESPAGLIIVVDTEGQHPARLEELRQGRDSVILDYPTAIGVAHPCIESWLLADPAAIQKGLKLGKPPDVPEKPEELPAPHRNTGKDPKSTLMRCAGKSRPLSSTEATHIAENIYVLDRLRERCPLGFAPFAAEVEQFIKPLFEKPDASKAD